MRGGDAKEFRVFEGNNLRIHGIAHHVQPRASQIGIVPGLFWAASIVQHGVERLGIPLVTIVEDHRNRFVIPSTWRLGEMAMQRFQRLGPFGSERCFRACLRRPRKAGSGGDGHPKPQQALATIRVHYALPPQNGSVKAEPACSRVPPMS